MNKPLSQALLGSYPDAEAERPERVFRELENEISGMSVVLNQGFGIENRAEVPSAEMWPYNLSDYLRKYIGKMVQIEYVLPNGRSAVKKGEIKVAGSNFVGIAPPQTGNLLLVDLNAVRSISIVNYKGGKNSRNRQQNQQRR